MLLPDETPPDHPNEALSRLRPQELAALLVGVIALLLVASWLSSAWSIPLIGWLPLIVGALIILVVMQFSAPWRD